MNKDKFVTVLYVYLAYLSLIFIQRQKNRIGLIMVSVFAVGAVDYNFEPMLGQIKDYEIGIGSFSAKHPALRSKSKD
jgi:hypothetical protein